VNSGGYRGVAAPLAPGGPPAVAVRPGAEGEQALRARPGAPVQAGRRRSRPTSRGPPASPSSRPTSAAAHGSPPNRPLGRPFSARAAKPIGVISAGARADGATAAPQQSGNAGDETRPERARPRAQAPGPRARARRGPGACRRSWGAVRARGWIRAAGGWRRSRGDRGAGSRGGRGPARVARAHRQETRRRPTSAAVRPGKRPRVGPMNEGADRRLARSRAVAARALGSAGASGTARVGPERDGQGDTAQSQPRTSRLYSVGLRPGRCPAAGRGCSRGPFPRAVACPKRPPRCCLFGARRANEHGGGRGGERGGRGALPRRAGRRTAPPRGPVGKQESCGTAAAERGARPAEQVPAFRRPCLRGRRTPV